jgi:SAM-dependent methyltransferase
VNTDHDQLCSSPEWAEYISGEIVPWCLAGLPLDGRLLEIGGGFGAATSRLVAMSSDLTVVEKDEVLAKGLRSRFPGLPVVRADATATPLPSESFDMAVCFTMLHHVTPASAQDLLFHEIARLLRPGAWYAGTDSLGSDRLRDFHSGDVYEPVDPSGLAARLEAAGFTDAETELGEQIFRFRARRLG